ncbi:MAG TPA: serine/threonine-protein kinase [Polyangia bacterium]|nr:serine/threonine-protein kinase [Polyangia bacterium]
MIDVGQTVGNYRITAELGEGGMGKVFLAEHPVIGRKAALKVIHPQFARNADVVARFVNEARAVTQIGHDHIVEVTDFGHTEAGDFYFIMEYLPGDMLSEQIGRLPFPPARAVDIAVQIADALEASHRQGVIHRDLKPDNIVLIARDGRPDFVKVYDFGLAKLTHPGDGAPTHTETGIVMGTPFYMSPEQCDGRREVDHRADIYALGVILFQMLTGQVPFQGEGCGEVMAQHLTCTAPPVRRLAGDVPRALEAIVARALDKDPDRRFQTMADLRDALLAARDADAAGVPATLPAAASAGHDDPELGDLRPKRNRSGALILGLGAFALVAVVNLGLHRLATPVLAGTTARRAATVRVNFSSDPDGATVTTRDGAVVGVTPFSMEIPYGEAPVEYLVRKDGYVAKVSAFVPNLPMPVFAVLEKKESPPPPAPPPAAGVADVQADPPPEPRPAHARQHHPRPPVTMPVDGDDIMRPSTW